MLRFIWMVLLQPSLFDITGIDLFELAVPFIEIIATRLYMKVALFDLQVQQLWMEDDCITIVKWLSSAQGYPGMMLSPLLMNLLAWEQRLQLLKVTHINREENLVANFFQLHRLGRLSLLFLPLSLFAQS